MTPTINKRSLPASTPRCLLVPTTAVLWTVPAMVLAGDGTFRASPHHLRAFLKSIAAGQDESCGIASDGTIACWGATDLGIHTPPSGTFEALDLGRDHACALDLNQDIECWGLDESGSTQPPSGSFIALSMGNAFGCGIGSDQTLACWGLNDFGQSQPPPGAFLHVSAGRRHACAMNTNSQIECWGMTAMVNPPQTGSDLREKSTHSNHEERLSPLSVVHWTSDGGTT